LALLNGVWALPVIRGSVELPDMQQADSRCIEKTHVESDISQHLFGITLL